MNQIHYVCDIDLAQIGWGGRIRTSVWRDQNPLPYRLATPQLGKHQPTNSAQSQPVRNLSSKGESFSPRAKYPSNAGGNLRIISRATIHGLTGQKNTGPRASQARRTEDREPIERMCNFRITASHHAQAIVPSTGRQETVNCDGRRIPCQFRILKYLRGADQVHLALKSDS